MTLRNAFDGLETETTGEKIVTLLGLILNRLSFPSTAGETRAIINSGTITTVTTVSTLSNITSVGNFRMDMDQMASINAKVSGVRSQIAVS